MKRTSYILIALLAFLCVGAFLAPRLILKRVELNIKVLTSEHRQVTMETGLFMHLILEPNYNISPDYSHDIVTDPESRCLVTVCENEDLSRPRITMDKSWADNVKITAASDTLLLKVDLHSLMKEGTRNNLSYSLDNRQVATIEVPAGMLHKITGSGFYLTLEDLESKNMTLKDIYYLSAEGCRFDNLMIE